MKDRVLVFSSAGALRKLTTPSPAFVPIVFTDEGEAIREQYWREVYPDFLRKDLSEVLDRLLDTRRPRAAFSAVHFALQEVETSRLKRLLEDVGTCGAEPSGS